MLNKRPVSLWSSRGLRNAVLLLAAWMLLVPILDYVAGRDVVIWILYTPAILIVSDIHGRSAGLVFTLIAGLLLFSVSSKAGMSIDDAFAAGSALSMPVIFFAASAWVMGTNLLEVKSSTVPAVWRTGFCVAMLCGGLFVDYFTGPQILVWAIYLMPVGYAALQLGLFGGIVVASLATLFSVLHVAAFGSPFQTLPGVFLSLIQQLLAFLTLVCVIQYRKRYQPIDFYPKEV
jgi:hypothetical protein